MSFFYLISISLFSFFLVFILYFFNLLLSSTSSSLSNTTSFESGFVSVGKIQSSFSLHFFVIMLLFVIFDVEVVLLIGALVSDFSSLVSFFFIFLFVFFGLYLEWFFGKLLWVY